MGDSLKIDLDVPGSVLRVPAFSRAASALLRDRTLLLLVLLLSLVRFVYVISYPFFIEGDGYTYYELLMESQSHLLHATGYVFFSLIMTLPARVLDFEPAYIMMYSQHLLTIAAFILLYLALRQFIARWISFFICLLPGIDAQMVAAAGTSRPEFFQADILILLVAISAMGLKAVSIRAKRSFYFVSGILAVAGYLAKYNFAPLFAFCLIPLFDVRLGWRSRFRMLALSVCGGALLYGVFLGTFHYPTTGSVALNLEHGWIHMLKLQAAQIPLEQDSGIATQKYTRLVDHLPELGPGPGPWKSINAVPPDVRAPFRRYWLPLLTSSDPAEIQALADGSPGPEERESNYYEPAAFYRIYYHLGLIEAETLLRAVYWEGISLYPDRFALNVWNTFLQSTDFKAQYMPYLPMPDVYEPPSFFDVGPPAHQRALVFKAVDWSVMMPQDLAAQIWYPGAKALSYLAITKYLPARLFWLILILGLVPLGRSVARGNRLSAADIYFVMSVITLVGILALSAVLLMFRMKELILCQPLIFIVLGFALSVWVRSTEDSAIR